MFLTDVYLLEAYPSCKGNEFTCSSGRCIPQRWVCDQFNDCGDYSDEKGCGEKTDMAFLSTQFVLVIKAQNMDISQQLLQKFSFEVDKHHPQHVLQRLYTPEIFALFINPWTDSNETLRKQSSSTHYLLGST